MRIFMKFVLAGIIFLLASEWGLRLFKDQIGVYYPAFKTFPPIYAKSDTNTFALEPDTDARHYNYFNEFIKDYHINSAGYRGGNTGGSIIMFGDSFIFGTGLNDDETVAQRLEKLTGEKVLNAGVPGYSVDNAYVAMKGHDPSKITILGVFLGNDAADIKGHKWVTDDRGLPVKLIDKNFVIDDHHHRTSGNASTSYWKYFLRTRSYLYTVFSESRYKLKWKLQTLMQLLTRARASAETKTAVKPADISKDEAAQKMELLLAEIGRTHPRLLVAIIPSVRHTDYENALEKRLLNFMRQNAIEYMVLPDAPDGLSYTRDCHWTPEGARLMAGAIYGKLKELCWL